LLQRTLCVTAIVGLLSFGSLEVFQNEEPEIVGSYPIRSRGG